MDRAAAPFSMNLIHPSHVTLSREVGNGCASVGNGKFPFTNIAPKPVRQQGIAPTVAGLLVPALDPRLPALHFAVIAS